jgi:hypothetical protein
LWWEEFWLAIHLDSFEAESEEMSRFGFGRTPFYLPIEVRKQEKKRYQIKLRLLDFL